MKYKFLRRTMEDKIVSETFSCSICLDLLKDPVTIPCGHSYCMSCVDSHWDEEEGKKRYSCPQCRHSFTQRPVLVKNTMLVILLEGLKKNGPPAAVVCPSATHGDVFCDLCSGRKVRAVKSCLQCLVSYCKEHLQPHYDVVALKKHKLVEPTENLRENICSEHDEMMKMFCRSDQQCICYLCSVDQHKDHDTVTAAAKRAEKQRELQTYQQNILHRLDHKHKEVDLLQQQVKNSSRSSNAALELSDRSLKELQDVLEKIMTEVKQQVISTQEAEENRVKELQDKVKLEINELKKTITGLDTLSQTEDHMDFLHKFASVSKVTETSDSVNSSQSPPPFQDMVTAAVSKLRSALQGTSLMEPPAALHKPKVISSKPDSSSIGAQGTAPSQQMSQRDGPKLRSALQETSLMEPPAALHKPKVNTPKTDTPPARTQETVPSQQTSSAEYPALSRANLKQNPSSAQITKMFQNNFCRLTLDRRTLNNNLVVSKGSTSVQRQPYYNNYLHNPDRFTDFRQVVTRESLTGQCFWEVLGDHTKAFTVAVTYKDIRRDGPSTECSFGRNAKSWALECYRDHFAFLHDGVSVHIRSPLSHPRSARLGIFLDHSAGILSFYQLLYNEEHHIHTIKTTFTQPLLAGVRLEEVWSTAEFPSGFGSVAIW